jgi:hypothetical protein
VVLHPILPILPYRIALILRERIEGRLDMGKNAAICETLSVRSICFRTATSTLMKSTWAVPVVAMLAWSI